MPTHENRQRPGASHGGALVTLIGESLVDIIDDPYRGSFEPEALPGGSPLNVAVGCARLDLRANLITHFAEDPHGLMIADYLATNGVGTIVGGSFRTSTALASLDSRGAAQYTFSISWDITGASIPALAAVEGSLHVHTGSIATMLSPGDRLYAGSLSPPARTPPSAMTRTAARRSARTSSPPANRQKTLSPSAISSKPAMKTCAGSTPTGRSTSQWPPGSSSDQP